MYQIIASGSTGNAVLYHENILADCGIPFASIKPFLKDIQLVLLTHEHSDHINIKTLYKLAKERPTIRFGCGQWMKDYVDGIKNVDFYEAGQVYKYVSNYGSFSISPITLYHDVKNFGYRIFKDGTKIIHCTDTFTLEGVTAIGYDLYAIEHSYDEETIMERILAKEQRGEFAHERGAINSHLSEQQARDFIFKNRAEHSQVLRLHETKSFL
jgi:phosphoribosyl 1,2-cyclic phosphodiesterase